jgi:hypothetical protein
MEKADKKIVRSSIRQLRPGGILDDRGKNSPLQLIVKRFKSGSGELSLHSEDNKDEKRHLAGRGYKFWRSTKSVDERIGEPPCESIDDTMSWTDSDKIFAIARAWLKNCCASHQCSTQNGWVPTRLVNIDPHGMEGSLRVQMMKDQEKTLDGQSSEYLTLSHCWGGRSGLRLTISNVGSLIQGFLISDMPATFQDAVKISRQLGYKYLWIDSRCIIQDDAEDWAREARRMADAYQNSVCTFAALFTESTHSGCFSVRYEDSECKEPHYFRGDSSGILFAMQRYHTEDAELNVEDHNLNTLAWVFQERLLRPRTLGFSETGIIWDCKEAQYREGKPTYDESKHKFANRTRDKEMLQQATKPILQGHTSVDNKNDFLMAWFELVTDYSRLNMTFPSDKFAVAHRRAGSGCQDR